MDIQNRTGNGKKPRGPYTAAGILVLAAAALLLVPATAFAHQETGSITGIVSGLSHPVSGMDHILAMIAVGL